MEIKIYMLNAYNSGTRKRFISYGRVQKYGGVVPKEYDLIWQGEVNAKDLEEIYEIFNRYDVRPKSYSGRSLSIGDVVVTPDGAFYCDEFGFIRLDGDEGEFE